MGTCIRVGTCIGVDLGGRGSAIFTIFHVVNPSFQIKTRVFVIDL